MSATISFIRPGRPGHRHSDVHFSAISRRYLRSIVSGVTLVAACRRTPTTESLALRCEAVLLHQVIDHVLLVTIDPSSQGGEQKPQREPIGSRARYTSCRRERPRRCARASGTG